ncbi:hypothetical protein N7493_004552 [Penicillium malachiteum]|uniref:LYR motif-containing protein Cup1-like N-terminal domain-containing protein n=1 Tax=Penicillium malachiteum TaxID=1324776 RepID=A0AAD6HNT0_9EURO|nr:hypothetical protein N7493_004552 [Penicillium malachiteum]
MPPKPRISFFSLRPDAPQWQHLLRATLQECSYLPDPIARTYMRSYVVDRYRRAFKSNVPDVKLTRAAKQGLTLLHRANEGYSRALDRVMLMSYGRIGKRRHELVAQLLSPKVPENTEALRDLINSVPEFEDGWVAPEIITALIKSQMNHGVFTASRVRPQIKSSEPVVPEKNIWGRPLSRSRRFNIRHAWYHEILFSVLPPLPERDLEIMQGLIAGTIPWKSRKQRPVQPPATKNDIVLDFLTDGPQKENTFGPYVNGRPHNITTRFMQRQWRRISALVPRIHWNDVSKRWNFDWDSPKSLPQVAFAVEEDSDLDGIFGSSAGNAPKS